MRITWSPRAYGELRDIGRFIAADNPRAARAFVARIKDRVRRVARTPMAGRIVPEFDRDDLREVLVGDYRIVYRVGAKEIHVVTVRHGHRLLGSPPIP